MLEQTDVFNYIEAVFDQKKDQSMCQDSPHQSEIKIKYLRNFQNWYLPFCMEI